MAKILVVDDEERIRQILKLMLMSLGHDIDEAFDGRDAFEKLEKDYFDLVISDIRMDRLDGRGLLKKIKEEDIPCPVVFITAFASTESVVEALRLGAVDYLVKPFDEKHVEVAVERALGVGRLLSENRQLKLAIQNGTNDHFIFASSAMKSVEEMSLKVAQSDATVLITGESGTGKEVIARLIHRASSRASNRFVAVNCAAITETLVEAELFGHEKGSFTGANARKEGKFEYADGGTLFLDEVGELPLNSQAKLLRAIQERKFQRVGGNQEIPVNTRIICATNQDLGRMASEKKFRQDLYYRLAVFPIHVPPLRERKEDILPLTRFFVEKFANINDVTSDAITKGALKKLSEYSWPGNVRELANVMERVMILKAGALPMTSDDLRFISVGQDRQDLQDDLFSIPPTGIDYDEIQRNIVQQAMDMTAGNQSSAARLLGLSRARFRTLLKLLEDA
ncbi:Transcriptional regulatory protein ZraR [Desulfamplus magnetovallimortis]|uniref:Transcriptional regulatory protein ZraR n=1 Tax=Desulfamplus magnetovallimortis TaxID=1246637 RepID=A0A1W1HCZ3_9BACT|nr:sigma-54 dependent transcriptional regulator [Desulfamplus magnetovallimortis]SLM30367.1 Transcriptional regulatory protein ZraR [Desulfamplus magnetovallimortis]